MVRFPVTCPDCSSELLASFSLSAVADALINDRPVRLYAACHDRSWDASDLEVHQIREYMSAIWLPTLRRESLLT